MIHDSYIKLSVTMTAARELDTNLAESAQEVKATAKASVRRFSVEQREDRLSRRRQGLARSSKCPTDNSKQLAVEESFAEMFKKTSHSFNFCFVDHKVFYLSHISSEKEKQKTA